MAVKQSFLVTPYFTNRGRRNKVLLSCEDFTVKVVNTVSDVLEETENGYVIEGNESSAKFSNEIYADERVEASEEEMEVDIYYSGGDYYLGAICSAIPAYSKFYGAYNDSDVVYSFDISYSASSKNRLDDVLDFEIGDNNSVLVENTETNVRIPIEYERFSYLFKNEFTPVIKIS
jgi:hypothetical protein